MSVPPPVSEMYLPTNVTVLDDGVWIPGFDFCASRGVQIHVITAWNPGDDRPSLEVNEAGNEQLRAEIRSLGFDTYEALGSDPDSSHAEKSWAVVGMTDKEAMKLGKNYGQVAIFRIGRGQQTVLGCFSDWAVNRRAEDLGRSAVLARAKDLQSSGVVTSHEVSWHPEFWRTAALETFDSQITKFADACRVYGKKNVISRNEVISLSDSVEDLFVGAMIFGFGPTGYGPSRVARIINENTDLIEKLKRQYSAASKGPSESWNSHSNEHRLRYLGPAFATKFAYFSARKQETNGVIPLIADINTSWAMWWLAGIPRSFEHPQRYKEYVDLAHTWGGEIEGDYGADEIERAIFKIGQAWRSNIKK